MEDVRSVRLSRTTVDELTKCPVCLERYNDPRMLPCGHTLCCECLEQLIPVADDEDEDGEAEIGIIKCPCCRKLCDVPEDRAQSFPRNVHLVHLFDGAIAAPKCPEHNTNDMDMYCVTCEVLVCPRCCLSSHKTHTYDDLSAHVDEFEQRLSHVSSESKCYKDILWKLMSELRVTESDINSKSDEAIRNLQRNAEQVRGVLLEYEQQLIGSILSKQSNSLKEVDHFLHDIEKKVDSIEKLQKSAEKLQTPLAINKIKELEEEFEQLRSSPLQAPEFIGTSSKDDRNKGAIKELLGSVVSEKHQASKKVDDFLECLGPSKVIAMPNDIHSQIVALVVTNRHIYMGFSEVSRLWIYSKGGALTAKCAIPGLTNPSGMALIQEEDDQPTLVIGCSSNQSLHFVYMSEDARLIDHEIVGTDFPPGHISIANSHLLVVDQSSNHIVVLSEKGEMLSRIATPTGLIKSLSCAVQTQHGNYAVLDKSTHAQLLWLDANFDFSHKLGSSHHESLRGPCHMVQDPTGQLIIADTLNNKLRVIDPSKQMVQHPLMKNEIAQPVALCLDLSNNKLYVGHGEPGQRQISVYNYGNANMKSDVLVETHTLRLNMYSLEN